MTFDWKNFFFRLYLRFSYPTDFSATKSIQHQQQIFKKIICQLSATQLGKDLNFNDIQSYNDFRIKVPVTQFDFYEAYIEKIKSGEQNVMTHQPVKWLAKTAGTTSGKSKLVPITNQVIQKCHVRGSFFALSIIHKYDETLNLLGHKNLLIPGGIYETLKGTAIKIADISAILVSNVPPIYRPYYVPSIEVQTYAKWEEKISKTVTEIVKEDVGTMSGVPTWILSILQKMREEFPFEKLTDVWKNLQVYFHGGVSFEPYRQQFKELVGSEKIVFYEVYNATEGFFAVQESLSSRSLLLLTDNYIFYEFVPLHNYYAGEMKLIPLSEVQKGVSYVLVITTPNGLIRYIIGDVVTFDSVSPFTFKITGRTQEYINAFGEDLLLSNVENALIKTNQHFHCSVRDYTVAPCYISMNEKGKIQFAIEFAEAPADLSTYEHLLDENLKAENSNYLQKRTNNLALTPLEVIPLPVGTFYRWLSSKNKLGGQNKIPRLVNGRAVIEEILAMR